MKQLSRDELSDLQYLLCEHLGLDTGRTKSVTVDANRVSAVIGTRAELGGENWEEVACSVPAAELA